MRTAGASLATFLDTTTAAPPLAHLVTVTPRVGSVVRWTDWTTDLVVGGNTYARGGEGTTHPVVKVGSRSEMAGLEIGTVGLTLYCGEVALLNGVRLPLAAAQRALEGATIKIERLYMPAPGDVSLGAMWLAEGPAGEARVSSSVVTLDVESVVAHLSRPWPKVIFQPGCVNMLYDTQCGLVKATYTVTGTASTGATTTSVPTSRTEATGYFNLGVITFTSGVCNGETRAVRAYVNSGGTFTPDRPLPAAPANGDTFSVYPGCDKTTSTCDTKFAASNLTRFRGFPFVPRNEAAT